MRVLVTGAAGRLGQATCAAFAAAGIEFLASDLRGERHLPYPVRIVDLIDREACYSLVEGCDTVVHLGNHPHERAADAQRVYTENAAMNINVFQAALEMDVCRVIYASSIQVINGGRYGDPTVPSCLTYLPLDGDSPARPANPYAVSKVSAELVLRYMAEHQKLHSAIALRLPTLTVPGFKPTGLQADSPKPLSRWLLDEGFAWLSFEDAARLIVTLTRGDLAGYRCYLPAQPLPALDLPIPEIIERFYASVPLRQPPEQMPSLVDISRLQAETGWSPQELGA